MYPFFAERINYLIEVGEFVFSNQEKRPGCSMLGETLERYCLSSSLANCFDRGFVAGDNRAWSNFLGKQLEVHLIDCFCQTIGIVLKQSHRAAWRRDQS